jgi:hypothetical protein
MTSASAGTICTTSNRIRNVVRNRKRNLATAVAASSASSPDTITVPVATTMLLTK